MNEEWRRRTVPVHTNSICAASAAAAAALALPIAVAEVNPASCNALTHSRARSAGTEASSPPAAAGGGVPVEWRCANTCFSAPRACLRIHKKWPKSMKIAGTLNQSGDPRVVGMQRAEHARRHALASSRKQGHSRSCHFHDRLKKVRSRVSEHPSVGEVRGGGGGVHTAHAF